MKIKFFNIVVVALLLLTSVISLNVRGNKDNSAADSWMTTEEAHEKIIQENEINIEEWLTFANSDLSEVSNGLFQNIPEDIGRKFTRQYSIGGIEEKYHKNGDYKPLFLINNDLETAKIGFLNSKGGTTIIDIDLAKIDENSVENLMSGEAYTVSEIHSL